MLGVTDLSFDFLAGRPIITAFFFILFVLLSIYLYRRTNPPLPRMVKITLAGLRLVAVIALFLALFEPVLSYRREFERKPRLTLLVDRSASMEIIENNRSRTDRIDSLLSSDRFKEFASDFDVTTVPFAGNMPDENKSLDPGKTAIGDVLSELAGKEMAEPSESWLIFSDGISNTGISPAEAASRLKTPVYSVGVGVQTSEKDVSIDGLEYNQIVFAGKPTRIKVRLAWQGMNNDATSVKIKSGEKELSSEVVRLSAGNLRDEIDLRFTPEKPGQQTFSAYVPPFSDEVSKDNNSRSFSVTVLKSRMKVLLVSDRLDWEFAFLNRFLLNSESVELTTIVYKAGGVYYTGRFPSQQSELNQYDLVILYDINLQYLKSRAELFESFLKDKGGGMFVILGPNYLNSFFPRWLDDYLPFVGTQRGFHLIYAKYNSRPGEDYLFHPAVRVSDTRQGIRDAWRNMPHFEALVPLDSITPNSEVLATAELGGGKSDYPILAFRRFGAGKVLATAAIPYWHWAFFGYGFGGSNEEYRRFLDGIVNWLSLKEESDPIKIVPDRTVYTRGEKVGFEASVFDLGFRPITGASGYVSMINEETGDSAVTQLIEKGEGRYRAEYDFVPPGRYRYTGVVEKDGKRLKEKSGQIAVETFSVEEYRRWPNFGTLASVSRQTGGEFYDFDSLDSLYRLIDRSKITVSTQHEIVIWSKFWLLAVFIMALAAEWLLRKRYQLI